MATSGTRRDVSVFTYSTCKSASERTHTLEGIAQQTGYSLDDIRKQVEPGHLATTGPSDDRVSEVEMERWRQGTLPERNTDES